MQRRIEGEVPHLFVPRHDIVGCQNKNHSVSVELNNSSIGMPLLLPSPLLIQWAD